MGVLGAIDETALEIHCATYATWRAAVAAGSPSRVVNPLLRVLHQQLVQFGMTPAARTGLGSSTPKPASKLARFFP